MFWIAWLFKWKLKAIKIDNLANINGLNLVGEKMFL